MRSTLAEHLSTGIKDSGVGHVQCAVIGVSGLLGSKLKQTLQIHRYGVTGSCLTRGVEEAIRVDITQREAIQQWFDAVQPKIVFLTAALSDLDYCEEHPEEAFRVNTEGARNVALEARRFGAKLVFYSTDALFDGREGPYDEGASVSPINVYGKTKRDAERAIQEILSDALIIRSSGIYGWDRSSRNLAMQLSEQLSAGIPIRLPEDEACTPTLVDYLAEASVRLVQHQILGIVNIAGRDLLSWAEWGRTLAKKLGLDPQLIIPVQSRQLQQKAHRPQHGGLKTDRLRQLMGTEAMPIDEALKRFRRQKLSESQISITKSERQGAAARLATEIFDGVRRYYELVHQHRPFVPFKTPVSYAGRIFDEREMIRLVDSALDFWLTLGPYGDLFEQKLRQFFKTHDFVLVNSGSSANLVAVMSLMAAEQDRHLKPGDEIITPAVTFPTTLAPIVQSGLIPVFVDAEVGTYNINPHLVEEAISPRTKALFIPHTLGNPCDLELLTEIAHRHRLLLVEDCCDALGSKFKDQLVGTFGELGTLSFFPAHHITMGEGGGVIVNKAVWSRIVRSLRDWGRDCWCAPGESNTCTKRFGWKLGDLPEGYDHKYIYSHIGYNLKPTDLQAAIGVAQADRIPEFVAARKENFKKLYQALSAYQDFLILPRLDPRSDPSWFGFPITVTNGISRRELVHWLESAKIETRAVFGGNILRQPAYRQIPCRVPRELTQSDTIMRDTFFIGVYPGLTPEMIDFVVDRFREFFARKALSGLSK